MHAFIYDVRIANISVKEAPDIACILHKQVLDYTFEHHVVNKLHLLTLNVLIKILP